MGLLSGNYGIKICKCNPIENNTSSSNTCFLFYKHTVKPLKTATPRGMKKWPSYRGGRLMEVILLRSLRVALHLGNEKVAVLQRWPS